MCIPYKKDIMQESHTYYLLSKYMDHTISTEELKTLRLLVNLSDDDELSLSLSHLWENGRPFEEVDERIIRDMFSEIQNRTRKERFVMVFRKLARIAAILLIPLLSILSGYLYFNPVDQKGSIGNLVVHADRGKIGGDFTGWNTSKTKCGIELKLHSRFRSRASTGQFRGRGLF